jgi:protein disulfide-isomerase
MKKITLAIATLACLTLGQVWAADSTWLTDLPKAQAQAKTEKKLVLLNFTGSDWCPWCWKLRDEIFKTPEFEAYAKKNLVLVEVDFPRKKEISAEQKKANKELSTKYKIEGYPTVVVLASTGETAGTLGYMKGGPSGFIAKLDGFKK